jgi:hypothetical protein
MRLTERLLVRHHPTGRFLAGSGRWVDDATAALTFEERSEALRLLAAWSCEPFALELVPRAACACVAGVA